MKLEHAIMGEPGKQKVEVASEMLKQFYYIERELMRTIGGYLVNISNWELKCLLPRHMWQDSLRADNLRRRVLEMRFPRKDVDQHHRLALQKLLQSLIRCSGDIAFLEGVYLVVKKELCLAYAEYLQTVDPLDDAPTLEFMQHFIPQIATQLDEIGHFIKTHDLKQAGKSVWQTALEHYIRGMGGFLSLENPEKLPDLFDKPSYQPPKIPKRDPKFVPAQYMVHPQVPEDFIAKQVWYATIHSNEMWACEITGLVLWEWDDMPWEFYMDCSRWSYDEARHTNMGCQRLKAWGLEPGIDTPLFPETFVAFAERDSLSILALLHALELTSVGGKSVWRDTFESNGDSASSQDTDFDWADESIHLLYGHKWVLHRLQGDMDALEDLKEDTLDYYNEWKGAAYPKVNYEPFAGRTLQKIKEIEARR